MVDIIPVAESPEIPVNTGAGALLLMMVSDKDKVKK
jgi:hypothetical protein